MICMKNGYLYINDVIGEKVYWDSLFDRFDLDPNKGFNVFNDKMKD